MRESRGQLGSGAVEGRPRTLNWVGFWMRVTRRSSSSGLSSPALNKRIKGIVSCPFSRSIRCDSTRSPSICSSFPSLHIASAYSLNRIPSPLETLYQPPSLSSQNCFLPNNIQPPIHSISVASTESQSLPLVEINISLLADDVRVTSSNSLDLGQGEHDLSLSIDVGVEQTQNVLELNVGCGRSG